jgi:hypothetical protein
MKRLVVSFFAILIAATAAPTAEKDSRVYELRVYKVNPGKLPALKEVYNEAVGKFMKKYDIELLGAWTPADEKDERLFALLVHKDMDSADKNYKAFLADADFRKIIGEKSKDGPVASGMTRFFLNATDYSPAIKAANVGNRIFELRTYITTPNNLEHLNARFRDHTCKLFEKYGMTNVAYFNFDKDAKTTVGELLKGCAAPGKDTCEVKPDAEAKPVALVYFITHKDADAMKSSFGKFGQDPGWTKARKESEVKGGGSLTAKDGVKSLILKPLDGSQLK